MISLDEINSVRKQFEDVQEELSKFFTAELCKCADCTIFTLAEDAWHNSSSFDRKTLTRVWVDLEESITHFKLIGGYNYEGNELSFTLPFQAIEPDWIAKFDIQCRAHHAQKELNTILEQDNAKKEAETADRDKRRKLYEELRKEFANEV